MLSTRTGYAVLALACLSKTEGQLIKVEEITKRADIPKPYLHKILNSLEKTGLIASKRGYRGGVSLGRPANQITLMDVANAAEGDGWSQRCLLGMAPCGDDRNCPIHEFWREKKELVQEKLCQLTLDQVEEFESREGGRLKSIDLPEQGKLSPPHISEL